MSLEPALQITHMITYWLSCVQKQMLLLMHSDIRFEYYSLFTFSWPRFESGSLRNGGMLILRLYFAVDGMPIEMYGESWIAGLLTSDDIILYMAGFGTT